VKHGWTLLAALFWAGVSLAQSPEYPTRPVRIIVGYSPGGGVDIMTRAVAHKLTESLGQPVPVENRPGANGMVGAQAVARSAADGHTLGVIDRAGLTINPSLHRALSYDPLKDFVYTGVSTELQYVLTVSAKLPVSTFQEFVAYAKARPGVVNFASFGTGSLIHLNFEQMNSSLGIQMAHVPYKGSTAAAQAVITGDAGVMMSSYAGVAPFLRDGRLRAIAVGRPTRLATLPGVPTMAEAGGEEETMTPGYFTFVAAAGTPHPIVMKLHAEIARALAAPDMAERLAAAGMEPHTTTPEQFAQGVRRDIARFSKLVSALGIPPQ
jgi:tripartite-type tricarboxylate transporter receptor subunit TctC